MLTTSSILTNSDQEYPNSHSVAANAKPFHVLTVGVMKAITMWYGIFVAKLDLAACQFLSCS
jgi:hypothetical protein